MQVIVEASLPLRESIGSTQRELIIFILNPPEQVT